MRKLFRSPRLPSLSPHWKNRLIALLEDVLDFSDYSDQGTKVLRAESSDSRTILELFERDGVLEKSVLQLALPKPGDLELLKLSCWTLIWLKTLFPDWEGVEAWVQSAAHGCSELNKPIEKQLSGYVVSCVYDPHSNVLDYQISKSKDRSP